MNETTTYIAPEQLDRLISAREAYCLSMYLPTYRAGPQVRQNPIRLKSLLGEAGSRLAQLDVSRADSDRLLEPVRELLHAAEFWQHQSDGLALFRSPSVMAHFRLPVRFEELVVIGQRFHLKPLIPLVTAADDSFYLLALSKELARVFRGSRSGLEELELDDAPRTLTEAVGSDFESRPDHLTGAPPLRAIRTGADGDVLKAGQSGIFHARGYARDSSDAELERYLRRIDDGLQQLVGGSPPPPLIVAAVERNLAAFLQLTQYPNVVDEGLIGNPDELGPGELHQRAWQLLRPRLNQRRRELAGVFEGARERGFASDDLREVLVAAGSGRVDTLFVCRGERIWGRFDPQTLQLEQVDEQSPEAEDLLDTAALLTYQHAGTVHVVAPEECPTAAPLAATFRFALPRSC
jgi:hypothetical protein